MTTATMARCYEAKGIRSDCEETARKKTAQNNRQEDIAELAGPSPISQGIGQLSEAAQAFEVGGCGQAHERALGEPKRPSRKAMGAR
jgi:hypothetical protein